MVFKPAQYCQWLNVSLFLVVISLLFFLSGCAQLPENRHSEITYAIDANEPGALHSFLKNEKKQHPGKSGFYLLDNGLDALVARVALMKVAEKSIDLQYYLYTNDYVGALITEAALVAADRGVRVRFLLDDMGLEGRDEKLAVFDMHPNIDVRVFNPFTRNQARLTQFITGFGSVTRRMHNKSLTIDNQITIVGGRNIGGTYFAADPDLAFGDIDVMTVGPVVNEVSTSFDKYWNNALAYPISTLYPQQLDPHILDVNREHLESIIIAPESQPYIKALQQSELAGRLRNKNVTFLWGEATAVYDKPDKIIYSPSKTKLHLVPQLEEILKDVDSEVIFLSAYFVPGPEGVEFFKSLTEQGIKVRILTNSLSSTDVAVVHSGYAKYRKDLLRAGVELYEVAADADLKEYKKQNKKQKILSGSSKASLHAKAYIFDREQLFIGSFNFDPRSWDQNTELGIVFTSKEMGRRLGEKFDKKNIGNVYKLRLKADRYGGDDIEWVRNQDGKERVYTSEPDTGFFKKFFVSLAGLLPLESQL